MKLGSFALDTDARTVVFGRLTAPLDASDFSALQLAKAASSLGEAGAEAIEFSLPTNLPKSEVRAAVLLSANAALQAGLPASIRTEFVAVARAAADSGMLLIHDASGSVSAEMASVAQEFRLPLVVSYRRSRASRPGPGTAALVESLQSQYSLARVAGIDDIWLSPGLSSNAPAAENIELLDQLGRFILLDRPVLITIERQHQLPGAVDNHAAQDMGLGALVAACTIAADRGVHFISTSDVRGAVQAARVVALFGRGGRLARELSAASGAPNVE